MEKDKESNARNDQKHKEMNHQNGHEGHESHEHSNHHQKMALDFRNRFLVSALITIPILFLSPLIQEFFGYSFEFVGVEYVLLALSTIVYAYGGYPFIKGFVQEFKDRELGMMTLVSLAISVSYLYSLAVVVAISGRFFFWELATLVDIMLLGHWIEMRSVLGASNALEKLVKLLPTEAHLLRSDGSTKDVPVNELATGDHILVKPGEKIPTDGEIVEGESSLNESFVTGESTPVYKTQGNEVIGGSINGEGSLTVNVTKTGDETYISQVIELVRQTQQSRSRAQDLANKAAYVLTVIAVLAGSITFVGWFWLAQSDLTFALERTVTVMVITCPHALGLAVPLVVSVSTSLAAQNGLLLRDRSTFERSRQLDAVVFDKTGTLTQGAFGVKEIIPLSEWSEEDILRYASSLESHSEHPIAQGITKALKKMALEPLKVTGFQSITGKGVRGEVEGKEIFVVSPNYLEENSLEVNNDKVTKAQEKGMTTVFLVVSGELIGAIALADLLREESKEAIRKLQEEGIATYMLTGDNERVARWVSQELGLDDFYAEVMPDQKAEVIKEVQKEKKFVAMVGDGVNDAPALVQANVGIAIGAGTDIAVESADIVLVRNDPRDILSVIGLAENTYSKMRQNLFWASGYNMVAIPLAAGILAPIGLLLSPAVGAILMSLSTVIVAVNAKLLTF